MRCTNCQYENDPSAVRCAHCGAPLKVRAASTDTQVFKRNDIRNEMTASDTRARSPYARPLPASGAPDAAHDTSVQRQTATRRNPLAADVAQSGSAPRPASPRRDPIAAANADADNSMFSAEGARQTITHHNPLAAADPINSARGRRTLDGDVSEYSDNDEDARKQAARPAPARRETRTSANAQARSQRPPRENEYARKRLTEPVYEPDEMEDDENEEQEVVRAAKKPHRNKLMIGGIALLSLMALMLLVICFLTFTPTGQRWKASVGMNAPASAYWQLGDEALEAGDYSAAATYYESALERDSSDYDGAIKLAQTLMVVGNTERAERAYRLAITLRPTESAPYEHVISLMRARNASESDMVAILRLAFANTADENYHTQLLEYGPSPVRFDPEEGEYSYAIKLQMASDEGAVIYYTTDGSQPTIYSSKYVLPIELGEGVFNVRAIAYLNDLYSGEVSKTYTIAFPTVQAPQFASKPGKYSADDDGAKVIKVAVPDGCTVLYTTDGSEPSADSTEYSDGIRLKPGTYKLRMIARNADGAFSSETSAEYEIIGELKAPFSDEDRFKSFYVDVTTQDDVNKQFKKLVSTSGDPSTFFTQHYSFGEVDFTVKNGTPVVTAVRIINNDIRGVRDTKVGWAAEDVIALFRDEKHAKSGNERELYTLDNDQYGWLEYNDEGDITSINYMYTRGGTQLVELHYTVEAGKVSAMEYCISDM